MPERSHPAPAWRVGTLAGRARRSGLLATFLLLAGALPAQAQFTLKGSAAFVDSGIRLTPAKEGQSGSAWTSAKQPVAGGFAAIFQFRITEIRFDGGSPGDGFAFVVQNRSVHALGGGGGLVGYGGIPNSIAVEFDTWPNSEQGDPASAHVSIHTRGTLANSPDEGASIARTASIPNLLDGRVHTAVVAYTAGDGGWLEVVLDGRRVLGVSVDLATLLQLDSGRAYVGWTASTGASWENHDITFFDFRSL
jgi:hypothetical protein